MEIDVEKLKKFEKLPPDVKRQLALYMAKWKEKKKESQIRDDFMSFCKTRLAGFCRRVPSQKSCKKI